MSGTASKSPSLIRSPLLWRLFAINGVAVLAFLVVSSAYLEVKLRADMLQDLRTDLLLRAQLAQAASREATELTARRLSDKAGARVTLIARDGTVISDSEELAARMDNHLQRPEVQGALRDGTGWSRRESATRGREFTYVAVADPDTSTPIVRVALDSAQVDARMRTIRDTIWVTVGVLFLIGLALSLAAAHFLLRPVFVLRDAATEIARGNLDAGVEMQRRDELGELAGAFNTMAAQLRQRIAQLEANRRELAAIMDNMSEGLVLVDPQGVVTLANKAATALLGQSAVNLVGRPLWEGVRLPEVDELLAALPQLKEPRRLWVEDRANPQTRRVLSFVVTPLFDTGRGRQVAVLLVGDATEDQKLAEMRQEFVANVSHELKTPLTSIAAYTETLLDGAAEDESVRRPFLEKIRVNAGRLSKLVSDILTVSRLESGTGDESRARIDLNDLVTGSVKRHQESAEAKGLQLALHRADAPAFALVNEEDMLSAVDNLLDNAIAYTHSGRVDARVAQSPAGIVIEVRDTGVGIPPDSLTRVFERFYRVDKARSRAMGGTGLGLAIVKHVALKHGGRVDAESEPGKGSTFRIILPLAPSSGRRAAL